MEKEIYDLHINAGFICGKEHTCGNKINYGSEETATKSAEKMSIKYQKEMEAYPCAFCNGWHIGRKMSIEELKSRASDSITSPPLKDTEETV